MRTKPQWRFKPVDDSLSAQLVNSLGVTPFLARLLVGRGLSDPELARRFLHGNLKDLPDPFLMKGMGVAVDRLMKAIKLNEKIVIYGDYDVDGTTGTSLLVLFFREIGVPVEFYIPNRLREGYSLQIAAIEKLKSQGCQLLITVDNGISSLTEAKRVAELGMDLIITDHHQVLPQGLPQALAILNPQQSDCPYPAKEICGTVVAFNLIIALRQKLRQNGYFAERKEPNLSRYLDFAALATVADVVPLTGANRILVRLGLERMQHTEWPGLKALKDVSGIDGEVTSSHLGFRLGPRLNACGRLYDAATGVRLLLSTTVEEAIPLAKQLHKANTERQEIEKEILEQAIADVGAIPDFESRMGFVLGRRDWHPGVIGIVASRLVEKFRRPFVMLGSDGERLKGSARTCGPLNLVEALSECAPHLLKYGGHKAAAGVTLDFACQTDFVQAFNKAVSARVTVSDLEPVLNLDAEIADTDSLESLYEDIRRLAPFGQKNPEPLFSIQGGVPSQARVLAEKHVKFYLGIGRRHVAAIAFGRAGECDALLNPGNEFALSIDKNVYQGRSTLQLQIRDFRTSDNKLRAALKKC